MTDVNATARSFRCMWRPPDDETSGKRPVKGPEERRAKSMSHCQPENSGEVGHGHRKAAAVASPHERSCAHISANDCTCAALQRRQTHGTGQCGRNAKRI